MAHKKHKSKQAGIDHANISANEPTKASSNTGPLPLTSMKHNLSDDADKTTTSDRLKKRRKINSNTGLQHHVPSSPDFPATTVAETIQRLELAPGISAQELPPEVRHLSTKYNFTTMSILSSAKISDRVEKLLLRVENFSFADTNSKPGVVILHAKSEVASKMVSIVEIARQEIERNKGKWWHYSKLDAQIAELKAKPVKRRHDGKTLSEWEKERAGGASQCIQEAGGEKGRASEKVEHDYEEGDGDEELEDAFESMVDPKEADGGAKQSENVSGKKIRAVPVLTIYFARVPVPGLKELYGYVLDNYPMDAKSLTCCHREQTNS